MVKQNLPARKRKTSGKRIKNIKAPLKNAKETATKQIIEKEEADKAVESALKVRDDLENNILPDKVVDTREIGFLPDYDPDLTIDENLEALAANPGKQARFLSSTEDEVLYSGTRGAAKSSALIADPLPYFTNKNFRGLLIRKSMPDLRELQKRCELLYKSAYPGTKWKQQAGMFVFPSGATLELGYCDKQDDIERYRGQEYTWVGIDEIAQYGGSWIIDRLKASMRSPDPTLPIALRCCVDEGEVLTAKGWMPIQDVRKGDLVYSTDERGKMSLKPVTMAAIYPVEDEELVRYKDGTKYLSFTKDHRVVERNTITHQDTIIPFNEITRKTTQIARCHYSYNPLTIQSFDYPDIFASPSSFIEYFGNWLKPQNKLFSGHDDYSIYRDDMIDYFKQFIIAGNKRIPRDFMLYATLEQYQELLHYVIGPHRYSPDIELVKYTTVDKDLIDDIAEILVKLGYSTRIYPYGGNSYCVTGTLTTKTIQVPTKPDNKYLFHEKYTGNVYCIGVQDNETFFLRQKGFIWISGNTCNPWGPGKSWVKDRWEIEFDHTTQIGNQEERLVNTYETEVGDLTLTRKWFFGHWSDNKVLLKSNPNYIASLYAIPDEALRDAELHGSWDAVVGLAFPEFKKPVHVISPFKIPPNWYKWRACDWGYSTMAAVLWFAADWDDNVYIYRELTTQRVLADEFAVTVLELEKGDFIQEGYIDGSIDSDRGGIGQSIIDTMAEQGLTWIPADRSKGSRIASKQLIHQYLAPQLNSLGILKPKLQIFDTCKEIIQELSTVMVSENNPEDIDTSRKTSLPDHAIDALRYGLQAMPDTMVEMPTYRDGYLHGQYQQATPLIVDSTFGA